MRAQIMTVLVVEDEPQLRTMLADFLQQEGFTVLTAGCGSQAIPLFRSHPEIDLLITDIVMPGMDGPSLAALLKSGNPDLPVLLMSGSCDPKQIDNTFAFIAKPFSFPDLLGKVKTLTHTQTIAAA
jgi:two-component system, cell cycle sensor histidine kinase and response regulator CckA